MLAILDGEGGFQVQLVDDKLTEVKVIAELIKPIAHYQPERLQLTDLVFGYALNIQASGEVHTFLLKAHRLAAREVRGGG